jgi:hypothetical protein
VPWTQLAAARVHNRVKLRHEIRKVTSQNGPHDFEIDRIVAVDQTVAHAANLSPRYGRILLPYCFRRSSGCFSDDFEESNDCELHQTILLEPHSIVVNNEMECLTSMIQHVTQPEIRIRLRHRSGLRSPGQRHGSTD